ncbi:exo-alpha-sialidase [Streptomyces thermolineatus]|uniref:sialidase family protein n=1 Tax=Streptomyces thermolineatus TaxID=44033 RepID=UPI00384E6F38
MLPNDHPARGPAARRTRRSRRTDAASRAARTPLLPLSLAAAAALAVLAALAAPAAPAAAPARTASADPGPAVAARSAPDGGCTRSVPFSSGSHGYFTFRIPAVVQVPASASPDGRPVLVALAEGRRDSAADDGDIDLVSRRSFDGGCTWGPLKTVDDAGGDAVGNPAPVVDPASGDVVLLTCRTVGDVTKQQILRGPAAAAGARRVYLQRSTDAGATWSAPRDLTARVKPAGWRWYATGPGHAVALRHGPFAGRLVAPANHSTLRTGPGGDTASAWGGAHSLHSDDGGRTWAVGWTDQPPGEELHLSETTVAELPSGTLYVNARNHHGTSPATRADARSPDGGLTLAAPFRPQPELAGPVVQGSVLQPVVPGGAAPLLYSGPTHPTRRLAMALRASDDGGRTWREALRLSPDPAGYSDLVQLDPATVGLLYETGPSGSHDTITFARIPLASLR